MTIKLRNREDGGWFFWCPGCECAHGISSSWDWNGSHTAPTFRPSVLVYSHKTLIDNDLEGEALTAPENITETPRCHSFVTDGRIEFLGDSTHALAGQTVDLPAWPIRSTED